MAWAATDGKQGSSMSAQLDSVLTSVGERSSSLSQILDETEKFFSRFVAYPSEHAKIAHVLWTAHTHCMDEWDSTPRLVFSSPEAASGKSRALEITETVVPRPIESVNAARLPVPQGLRRGRLTDSPV